MQGSLARGSFAPLRFGKHIADAGVGIRQKDQIAIAVCEGVEVAPPFPHGRFLVAPDAGTSSIDVGRMGYNDATTEPLRINVDHE